MYKLFVLTLILMISLQAQCFTDVPDKCFKAKADIVFLLDGSGSIWPPDFKKQLEFVNHFVDRVDIGENEVRIGVVNFSRTAKPSIYLSDFNDKVNLKEEVLKISQEHNNTSTAVALNLLTSTMFTTERGARNNVRHIAFVLTDGVSQEGEKTQLAAKRCRDANIELFAIGIGNETNEEELIGIASEPKERHYIHVSNFSALIDAKEDILRNSCKEPEIAINIQEDCKNISVDVFFLLDSSNSIIGYDFKKQLNAVADIINTYSIGSDKMRIGLSLFSSTYKPVIHLKNGVEKSIVIDKLRSASYLGGGTNTGGALYKVRTEVYSEKSSRARILIVFTDGRSANGYFTITEAEKLRENGVVIFVVGVGPFVDQDELNAMSSNPSEEFVFNFVDMDELSKKVEYLSSKTCTKIVEEIPRDQEYCNSTKITDFVFALNNNYLGHRKTTVILKAIDDVIRRKIIREKFRFGMVFDKCPYFQDISFEYEDSYQKVQQQIRKYQNKPLYTIFQKLKNFEYSDSLNRRVSLVFVDESMPLGNLKMLAGLSRKNMEIYIVAIGKKTSFKNIEAVPSSHISYIPSYEDLFSMFYLKFSELFCVNAIGGNISRHILLEVHYNNPEKKQGVKDSSGIRFYVTPTLRKYDSGVMEIGLEYTNKMAIPPRQSSFTLAGDCVSECTELALPDGGIYIFASQLHTHLTGKKVTIRHIRNGTELPPVNYDEHYSAHFQIIKLLPRPVHILPGDAMVIECEYDTEKRSNATIGGFAITDEMCVSYLHYYPMTNLEVCKSSIDTKTLNKWFEFIKRWDVDKISLSKGYRNSYNSIRWTPLISHLLNKLYEISPLSEQCNKSDGHRFPGNWEGVPQTQITLPLDPPKRDCDCTLNSPKKDNVIV